MGLETGTYIADLVPTNPVLNDPESQGDDHIRLMKSVAQATFPGANRPFPIPTSVTKSADYTVLSTDQNKYFYINTASAAVSLTLPTLTSASNGWQITVMKATTDTNPVFILPPSGNLTSGPLTLAKTRRCIPGVPFRVMWFEGTWVVERINRNPVGSVIPFFGSTLPVGFEWANGQTLASASANYPDYNSVRGSGTTPDLIERTIFGSTMGASDPARITNAVSSIDPTTLESAGGNQKTTIAQANLPNVTLSMAGGSATAAGGHTPSMTGVTLYVYDQQVVTGTPQVGQGSANVSIVCSVSIQTGTDSTRFAAGSIAAVGDHSHGISGNTASINGNVAQTDIVRMPPAIIGNYLLVVE